VDAELAAISVVAPSSAATCSRRLIIANFLDQVFAGEPPIPASRPVGIKRSIECGRRNFGTLLTARRGRPLIRRTAHDRAAEHDPGRARGHPRIARPGRAHSETRQRERSGQVAGSGFGRELGTAAINSKTGATCQPTLRAAGGAAVLKAWQVAVQPSRGLAGRVVHAYPGILAAVQAAWYWGVHS